MYEERSGSTNWGSVVVNVAIIGFTAFALYLTHSLVCLLALIALSFTGNYRVRSEKGAPKKCCGGKKCSGAEAKPDSNGPDDGRNCGC